MGHNNGIQVLNNRRIVCQENSNHVFDTVRVHDCLYEGGGNLLEMVDSYGDKWVGYCPSIENKHNQDNPVTLPLKKSR